MSLLGSIPFNLGDHSSWGIALGIIIVLRTIGIVAAMVRAFFSIRSAKKKALRTLNQA